MSENGYNGSTKYATIYTHPNNTPWRRGVEQFSTPKSGKKPNSIILNKRKFAKQWEA